MTKHERIIDRITQHGVNLNKIFNTGVNPVILCKKLRRLENKGHNISIAYCYGYITMDIWEVEKNKIIIAVNKILDFQNKKIPVFFNSDPRGYCLKIEDIFVRDNNIKIHTDWEGYGILAPDF